MPPLEDVPDECEFTVEKADQAQLQTRTNGDTLIFSGLELGQEKAAILAWLVNSPNKLEVKVEVTDVVLDQ